MGASSSRALRAAALSEGAPSDLPHVDDCYFCFKCHYTKGRDPDARPTVHSKIGGSEEEAQGERGARRVIPTDAQWEAKRAKPNCTECWGCSTQLQPLKAMQAFGHQFNIEVGASAEWLFYAGAWRAACCVLSGMVPGRCSECCCWQACESLGGRVTHPVCGAAAHIAECPPADLPDTHKTGERAIVKVFCLPYDKVWRLLLLLCFPSRMRPKLAPPGWGHRQARALTATGMT